MTAERNPRADGVGRHYLAFVQHERLSSWIIRAVTPVVGGNLHVGDRQAWADQARRDHRRLGRRSPGRIWPWAYAAGATPVAGAIRPGDVLWVFGKMEALGREWPPSLVARMGITETHAGRRGWKLWRENAGKGTHPGFPFANAHRFYADPTCSRFYAYSNAVPQMLGLRFGSSHSPRGLEIRDDVDPQTIDGALQAWKHASTTADGNSRFRTIRRLHASSTGLLEGYAEALEQRSTFVSYRWADHGEDNAAGREALGRLRTLSERLVEQQVAVWLDRLMLPESKLKERQGNPVLEKILGDGIERGNLLLAVVTEHYGGPSAHGTVRPGYTAGEWKRAEGKHRLRWELEECAFERELGGRISARLGPERSPEEVALTIRDLLI